MQKPEDAPSGRNGHIGRLHKKGGLGTAGELFKNQREGGMRGFAFYEENTELNSEDILEREWERIFEGAPL